LLDAYARSRDRLPKSLLLVVVPRHPQRFDAVAALLAARQVPFSRRSGGDVDANVQVVLGDSVGELFAYYTAADVAFVAGSLLPLGGQNLIESLAAGVPTLIGPHTFNFQQASDAAVAAGAARRARDADDVFTTACMLLADARERAAMRERATAFMTLHAGAADRLWTWLAPRLSTADRTPPH
ncbi:MAG: 3-deoxy-D-manno-octulosonic acid transferase, partial [Betaproteobacteria bacterium]